MRSPPVVSATGCRSRASRSGACRSCQIAASARSRSAGPDSPGAMAGSPRLVLDQLDQVAVGVAAVAVHDRRRLLDEARLEAHARRAQPLVLLLDVAHLDAEVADREVPRSARRG